MVFGHDWLFQEVVSAQPGKREQTAAKLSCADLSFGGTLKKWGRAALHLFRTLSSVYKRARLHGVGIEGNVFS